MKMWDPLFKKAEKSAIKSPEMWSFAVLQSVPDLSWYFELLCNSALSKINVLMHNLNY
jgi:hypothetical protein